MTRFLRRCLYVNTDFAFIFFNKNKFQRFIWMARNTSRRFVFYCTLHIQTYNRPNVVVWKMHHIENSVQIIHLDLKKNLKIRFDFIKALISR